jgi:hypothetical protein
MPFDYNIIRSVIVLLHKGKVERFFHKEEEGTLSRSVSRARKISLHCLKLTPISILRE